MKVTDRFDPELPDADLTVIEHRDEIEFRDPDGEGTIRVDSDDVVAVGRVGDRS